MERAKKASNKTTLKRCAKCKVQLYCSHECQAMDWTFHKKVCSKDADHTSNASNPPKGLSASIDDPFRRLLGRTWLHNRPEEDVYKLLIDAYRLYLDDRYMFTKQAGPNDVYGGALDSRAGFHRFLTLAETKPCLLPRWWSPQKADECLSRGLSGGWSSLAVRVSRPGIIDHYGDVTMSMQLKIIAQQIYGDQWEGLPKELEELFRGPRV